MTTAQKIIKYFAIAFAILIIVSIFSGIMFGFSVVSDIFGGKDDYLLENLKDLNISETANVLDIDVAYSNLTIKTGDTLKAETNNKYITYKQDGDKIIIKEKKHGWTTKRTKSSLVIYIPEDLIFDETTLETGAGLLEIENINSKELNFNFGAGKVTIDKLVVLDNAYVDCGTGEISISDGEINNLDLDLGIGKFSITSKLTGSNKINAGIGELNVTLLGSLDDYTLTIDKGIGDAKLNGESVKSGKEYGNGENHIDIDGGIGSINVKTK